MTVEAQARADAVPYVVCSLNDIPSQKAYGFNLMRLDEAGQVRPLPIVIVRWGRRVFGYVNRCPHHGVKLDWERNTFLDPSYGTRLMCGKHGALFDFASGECVEGPCRGESLEPVALAVLDDDICITGVTLVEDDEEDAPVEEEE
jgi:nitrite reductase/ring-hydroxylating ferredoxin subunit